MSIKIDLRRESLSPAEKMQEDLSEAQTSYDKLLVAAKYGNIALARKFLAEKVSINPEPNAYVTTPLYAAVANKQLEMVKFLVQNGAEVNQVSRSNAKNTPLKMSIQCRDFEIFNYLLEQGAKINHKDGYDCTALHEAASLAEFNVDLAERYMKKLLSLGADVTAEYFSSKPQESAIFHVKENIQLNEEEKLQWIERINQIFSPTKALEFRTSIAGLLKYSVVCVESKVPTPDEDYIMVVSPETGLKGCEDQTQEKYCSTM